MTNETRTGNGSVDVHRQALVKDLKGAVSDAHQLIQAVADASADEYGAAAQAVQDKLDEARSRLSGARTVIREKSQAAAKATQAYVTHNPWTAIGIAAGVGVIAGFFIGRR